MTPSATLIETGYNTLSVRCFDGEKHELLTRLATDHAQHMATVCKQGHQAWVWRFAKIQKELGITAYEICAESWRRQRHEPLPVIATEMFDCWRLSPGHWKTACTPFRFFGASMAQGSNGVWYACVIAGGKEE